MSEQNVSEFLFSFFSLSDFKRKKLWFIVNHDRDKSNRLPFATYAILKVIVIVRMYTVILTGEILANGSWSFMLNMRTLFDVVERDTTTEKRRERERRKRERSKATL